MTDLLVHALQAAIGAGRVAPGIASLVAARGLPFAATAVPSAAATAVPTAAASAVPSVGATPVVPATPVTPVTPTPTTPTTPTTTGGEFPTVLLTALIWCTAAAALVILFMPDRTREERGRLRVVAVTGAAVAAVLAIAGVNAQINQEFAGGTVSYEESHQWLSGFVIRAGYHLGVDGISLPLLLLSTLLFLAVMVASWRMDRRVKLYLVLLLLLETGVSGTLCSLDYLLFLLFWGVELVPMYLLIAVWGNGAAGVRAAGRYAAFTAASTALLVTGVLLLCFKAAQGSFDFNQVNTVHLTAGIATAGFWLTFVAFAIRLAVVPLHGWMVAAQSESSAPVGVLVAGVVVTLGGYGLLRITASAFPTATAQFSGALVAFAVIGAVWGTVAALSQDDLRRMIAYTSVAQVSLVLLAIGSQSSIALNGAVLQLVAHGLVIGMLVLLVGSVQERTRTRSIAQLGGLAWQMPRLTALWVFAALAALGVPFLAGFSAEFLVFTGSFSSQPVATLLVLGSLTVTTGYLLWTLQRIFFGPAREAFARLRDASALELTYLLPMAVVILAFGLAPGRVVPMIANGVNAIVARLGGG